MDGNHPTFCVALVGVTAYSWGGQGGWAPTTPLTHSEAPVNTTTKIAAGTCTACGFVNATTEHVTAMTCGGCRKPVKISYVVGQHNDRVPCDGACQYAVGRVCSCACGGVNHRAGYIHVDLVPVWVRDRDAKRHAAKAERAEAKAARQRECAAETRAALVVEYPELAELDGERYAGETWGFIADMRAALHNGTMTPRQVDAAVWAVRRDRAQDAKRAAIEAEREAARAAGVRAPEGRVEFVGEIVQARQEEEHFGFHGRTVVRLVIKTDQGWRTMGTCPAALEPGQYNGEEYQAWLKALVGKRVRMTASVKGPSRNDPTFGFYTRPAKAAYAD